MDGHYEPSPTGSPLWDGCVVNFLYPGVGHYQYELCAGLLLYRGVNVCRTPF
jgi:hypothetical protein